MQASRFPQSMPQRIFCIPRSSRHSGAPQHSGSTRDLLRSIYSRDLLMIFPGSSHTGSVLSSVLRLLWQRKLVLTRADGYSSTALFALVFYCRLVMHYGYSNPYLDIVESVFERSVITSETECAVCGVVCGDFSLTLGLGLAFGVVTLLPSKQDS